MAQRIGSPAAAGTELAEACEHGVATAFPKEMARRGQVEPACYALSDAGLLHHNLRAADLQAAGFRLKRRIKRITFSFKAHEHIASTF